MIPYSLNEYLQSDVTLQGLMGNSIFYIEPYYGYQNDVAPILLYEWRQGIMSQDSYFLGADMMVYTVLDTDIDRAFKIRKRIVELLNVANGISTVVDVAERLNWSFLMRTTDTAPQEKNGYVEFACYFEIGHTQLS